MKKHNRYLALILAAVLLTGLIAVPSAFAEGSSGVKQYSGMTVFGDSIPCACGLPTGKSFTVAENSYYDIVSKAVGAAPYTSLAYNGSSIPQVMYLLGMDVPEEKLETAQYFLANTGGAIKWDEVLAVRDGKNPDVGDVTAAIQGSELICIALGSNDIATIPLKLAIYKYREMTDAGASQAEVIAATASVFTKQLTGGLADFLTGYPKIIERLKSLNPDATIVLIGAYNPYEKVSLFETSEGVAAGALLSSATKLQNLQLALWAKLYGCIYVDVFELSDSFGTKTFAQLIEDNESLDTHPTYEGHAWMAQQILNALPRATETIAYPRCTEAELTLNGTDAGRYGLSFKLTGWAIKNTVTGKYLTVGTDGKLRESGTALPWGWDGAFYTVCPVKSTGAFALPFYTLERLYLSTDENGAPIAAAAKPATVMTAYN